MRTMALALLAAFLVAAAGSSAVAAEVPLALKFAVGDEISYDVTFSGVGKITAPDGETSSLGVQGSCTFSQRAVSINPDGSAMAEVLLPSADLSFTLKGRQVRLSYAGGRIRWFADGKEQTPPQLDLSSVPLLRLPITVTLQPDGGLAGVALPGGQITDILSQAVPSTLSALPQVKSAPLFPGRPVRVGESWEQPLPLPAGPLASGLTGRTRRTLEEMMGAPGMEVAKISGFTELRYRPGRSSAISVSKAVSVSVPELHQTVNSIEYFNVSAGRLVRASYDVTFTTKVAAALAGKVQTGGVEARVRVVVTAQ